MAEDTLKTLLEKKEPLQTSFTTMTPQREVNERQKELRSKSIFDFREDDNFFRNPMSRQDFFIEGLVREAVGSEMLPDPSFLVSHPPVWKDLTDGIHPDFHKEFNAAVSLPHAMYIREALLEKQADLERLGAMTGLETAGRIAYGFTEPTGWLAGIGAGAITGGVLKASRAASVAKAAGSLPKLAEAQASVAAVAAEQGSGKAIVAGLAGGAGANAAFEKVRQSVNFEDDGALVAEAALMGLAFSAPFVGINARSMRKLSKTAGEEAAVLRTLQKVDSGVDVTPEEMSRVHKYLGDMSEEARAAARQDLEAITAKLDEQADDALWEAQAYIKQQAAKVADEIRGEIPDWHWPTSADAAKEAAKKEAVAEAMVSRIADLAEVAGKAKAAEWKAAQVAKAIQNVKDGKGLRVHWGGDELVPNSDVIFRNSEGRRDQGRVVHFNRNTGMFKVDRYPDLGQTPPGLERYVWLDPTEIFEYRDPSTGNGFLPGSVGAAQVGVVPESGLYVDIDGHLPPYAGSKIRQTFSAIFARSENPIIKELGFLLVKDPIGWNIDGVAQGWTASERKAHVRRVVTGGFYRTARASYDDYAKAMGWNRFTKWSRGREFYEEVTIATRSSALAQSELAAKYANNPDALAAIKKASSAQKEFYDTMLAWAKEMGVKGADEIQPNEFYVNRVWKHDGIRDTRLKFDEDFFFTALAHSFKNPKVRGDKAAAKKFMSAVAKTEFSNFFPDMPFLARDAGVLRGELKALGLSDGEIDSIIDTMFERVEATSGDSGRAPNLKYRFDLDESFTMQDPKTGEVFRVSDLLENDSLVLAERYTQSMGGHIALASVGFKSVGEARARITDAMEWHGENAYQVKNAENFNREKKMAEDILNNIIGLPMSDQAFDRGARFLNATRGITRTLMLGQLGHAAFWEVAYSATQVGFKAMWRQMPSLRQFIIGLRRGYVVDKNLARQIEMMVGFGNEMAASFARHQEISDYAGTPGLSRFEKFANTSSHVMDIASGNAGITSMFRQFAAMGAVQNMFDAARTGKVSAANEARWIHAGLSKSDFAPVMQGLKKYAKASKNGTVVDIDYAQWLKDDPKSYDKFTLWMSRKVRDAIQDHDIGETMPWMHTPVGKIFAELRTFMLVAHEKQFLKNISYKDLQAMQTFSFVILAQAISYAQQASINYAHDPEKLAEMLSERRIIASALSRASVMGVTPLAMGTAWEFFTRSPWIGSTVNTDNRNLFMTPSANIILRAITAGRGMAGIPFGPVTGDVFTQEEAKALGGLLPNMYLMRNLVDSFASTFPKSDPSLEQ